MPRTDETPVLVSIDGVPFWQASDGRTFPRIAGAEDPSPDDAADDEHGEESADAYDKDRAFKTIQKLRANEKAARDAARAVARERDELKAKQKQADDEQLSETERLRNRTAELERIADEKDRELKDARNRTAIERAAVKAGAVDPEDFHRLLNAANFDLDDKGNLLNAEALVKSLLKDKPYLAARAGANGVPATPRSNGTQTHEDRVKENIAKLRASGDYDPL